VVIVVFKNWRSCGVHGEREPIAGGWEGRAPSGVRGKAPWSWLAF